MFPTEIIDLILRNSYRTNETMVETFRNSFRRPTMLRGITMLKGEDVSDLYLFLNSEIRRNKRLRQAH